MPPPRKDVKKKSTKKGRKKKSKITEDPKVVRDIVSAAERHDNKALLEILDDPVFSKHYDLSDLGMSGESLVRACAVGNIIGAQAILEHKAPANIYNGKALHKACLSQQVDAIRLLMHYKADINTVSTWAEFTALHFAAQGGNVAVLQTLLDAGCDLDKPTHPSHCHNENGWTALHLACDRGHLEAVKLLVERGARVDQPNAAGETACSLAAENGHRDIVTFLVAHGADVHASRRGLSLVQWALYRADAELVTTLVSYGAVADMDTRVLWFSEDRPPEFGQWDFEPHDEAVAHAELGQRVLVRARAEAALREAVETQARRAAEREFDGKVSVHLFDSEEQMLAARDQHAAAAVNAALAEFDDPDLAAQRLQATQQTRAALLAALPPHTEDKKGYLTLGHVLRRDLSPGMYERQMAAIYQGTVLLRTRVAHQQLLSQVRWETRPAFDPAEALEGAAEPPTVHAFPPQVVHIISSYEL